MPRQIDYYFTLLSPWTYLGHATFMEIARRHGCTVSYKPTPLRSVFDETGGLPLPKRHPVRQRYRVLELQRWRENRGLPLVLFPKHFPFDASLADRAAIAIDRAGSDPAGFVAQVLAGVWARDEDLSRRDLIAALIEESGLDAETILTEADSEPIRRHYDETIAGAITAGVFGAPSYVLDGEVFWGQDRLGLLEDALAGGRGAFRIDATA